MEKKITEYAIINHGIEDAPYHNEDVIFESQDPEEIVNKLKDLTTGDCSLEEFTVEIYEVDEDGDFWQGSDFDTAQNFCARIAAERI